MTLRDRVVFAVLLLASPCFAQDPPVLQFPLDCTPGLTCAVQTYVDHDPGSAVRDYSCGDATYDGHDGTDISLLTADPAGEAVTVRAAVRGRVIATRDGMPDNEPGLPIPSDIAGRECGNGVLIDNGNGWQTQYCHMRRDSLRVRKGDQILMGQPVGLVGMSGRAEYPHLHLTVRKDGRPVDPFAFGVGADDCGRGTRLWSRSAAAAMPYVPRTALNAGFTSRAPSMAALEKGELDHAPPAPDAPILMFYVRSIHLKEGDSQLIRIKGPDGAVLAENVLPPLDRGKAQYLAFAGFRITGALSPGIYRGLYRVSNGGKSMLEREETFEF